MHWSVSVCRSAIFLSLAYAACMRVTGGRTGIDPDVPDKGMTRDSYERTRGRAGRDAVGPNLGGVDEEGGREEE